MPPPASGAASSLPSMPSDAPGSSGPLYDRDAHQDASSPPSWALRAILDSLATIVSKCSPEHQPSPDLLHAWMETWKIYSSPQVSDDWERRLKSCEKWIHLQDQAQSLRMSPLGIRRR